jgi:hypothetical protein
VPLQLPRRKEYVILRGRRDAPGAGFLRDSMKLVSATMAAAVRGSELGGVHEHRFQLPVDAQR